MSKFRKIIFLDEGNTILSPLAEGLMRLKLAKRGKSDIQVASRGSVVLFPEPVNPKIVEIAQIHGIHLLNYKAREIKESDFSESTLILTMDEMDKNRLYQKYKSAVNVFSIKSYLEKQGDLFPPIGGSIEEYANVCRELDLLLESLAEKEIDS